MPKSFELRIERVLAFRQTLSTETDRGCALMAAAYLDGELEQLFRAALVADAKSVDDMLDQSKPLGTFSSRIDMAFLLGLIGRQAKRDLHIIRKIRNDFGHDPEPITFRSQQIGARCSEFYHTYRTRDADPRSLFTNAVLGVLAIIHVATHDTKNAEAATDPHIDDATRAERQQSIEAYLASLLEPPQDGETA
jgi:DNA-binding MltR family transcriptional regulator